MVVTTTGVGKAGMLGEERIGTGVGKEEGVMTGEGRTGPEAETSLQGKGGTANERSSGKVAKRPALAEKEEGQERGKEEEKERGVEKEEEGGWGKEDGTRKMDVLFRESINTEEPP